MPKKQSKKKAPGVSKKLDRNQKVPGKVELKTDAQILMEYVLRGGKKKAVKKSGAKVAPPPPPVKKEKADVATRGSKGTAGGSKKKAPTKSVPKKGVVPSSTGRTGGSTKSKPKGVSRPVAKRKTAIKIGSSRKVPAPPPPPMVAGNQDEGNRNSPTGITGHRKDVVIVTKRVGSRVPASERITVQHIPAAYIPPKRDNPIAAAREQALARVKEKQRYELNGGMAPHGMVIARAGTGKTFTQVIGVANAYKDKLWNKVVRNLGFDPQPSNQQQQIWDFINQEKPKSVIYTAFNNSIVKQFNKDYMWLVQALEAINVRLEFRTLHSLGFAACRRKFRLKWGSVSKYKSRDLLSILWGRDLREIWKEKVTVIEAVEDLVRKVKINLAHEWDGPAPEPGATEMSSLTVSDAELLRLAAHYNIDTEGQDDEVFDTTRKILNMSLAETDRLDFEDQVWMPHVYDMPVWEKFQLGLVDESQDLNKVQQELVFRNCDRILLVGDDRQAIYGFAGADVASMENVKERLLADRRGCVEMHLTVTRRCGTAIVDAAKVIVPDFEAHPANLRGEVVTMPYAQAEEAMGGRDMVVCRTNAPLVKLCFGLLKQGRRCHIQGRDIGEGFHKLIKQSGATTVDGLLEWLESYEHNMLERMKKRMIVDEDALIALQDQCACLRMFAESALELHDVEEKINKVFRIKPGKRKYNEDDDEESDDPNAEDIKLTSVHRAKGLEAQTVWIIRPEKMPHPKAKTEWAKLQEMNLKYVAYTRAISKLVLVTTPAKEKD
jgi:DNA helicase-2/ATP-dependent DNA helicase PcrA